MVQILAQSDKGLDAHEYVELSSKASTEDVKKALLKWCQGFYAWDNSFCRNGYEKMTVPPPSEVLNLVTNIKHQIKQLEDRKEHLFRLFSRSDKMPVKKQLLFWLKDHQFTQEDAIGNIWQNRGNHFSYMVELKPKTFILTIRDNRDGDGLTSCHAYSSANYEKLIERFKKDGIS